MAGHRQEARLGAVGGVGLIAGLAERALGLGAVGDVAADALHFGGRGRHRCGPGLRARRSSAGPSAVAIFWSWIRVPLLSQRGVALLQHVEREPAADQRSARLSGELAIGVVGEGDAAVAVAQHDQVALRFEQAAGALLGFLQFPIAVDQRLVVRAPSCASSGAPSAAGCSASRAPRRRARTGSWRRSQRRGDCNRNPRPAAGDEAVGAAEGGGEDHEGADGEAEPRMTPRETAHAYLDPEDRTPHCQLTLMHCRRIARATMRRRPCEVLEAGRLRAGR